MAEAAEQVPMEQNIAAEYAAEVVDAPTEGHEPNVDPKAATPGGPQAALLGPDTIFQRDNMHFLEYYSTDTMPFF